MSTTIKKSEKEQDSSLISPPNTSCVVEVECAICFVDTPIVQMGSCRHQCLCLPCFVTLALDKVHIKCPICRTEVRQNCAVLEMGVSITPHLRDFDARKHDPTFVKFLFDLIKIMNPVYCSSSKLVEHIRERYMFNPSTITVSEAEAFLDACCANNFNTMENFYLIKNITVQLADLPWTVDIQKASSGICYYGNFGEEPSSMLHARNIYLTNHQHLIEGRK